MIDATRRKSLVRQIAQTTPRRVGAQADAHGCPIAKCRGPSECSRMSHCEVQRPKRMLTHSLAATVEPRARRRGRSRQLRDAPTSRRRVKWPRLVVLRRVGEDGPRASAGGRPFAARRAAAHAVQESVLDRLPGEECRRSRQLHHVHLERVHTHLSIVFGST